MKIYPVGLVGESHYQPAISRTHPGEPAYIRLEPDNPFDARALRVENNVGDIIGYIPKSSWLHRAIHDDGLGAAANIKAVSRPSKDALFGVVIDVTLTDDAVFERAYSGTKPTPRKLPSKPKVAVSPNLAAYKLTLKLLGTVKIPVTCSCGHVFRIPYKNHPPARSKRCPSCRGPADLDVRDIRRLDDEFFALAVRELRLAGLPLISRSEVEAFRIGRMPAPR